MSIKSSEIWKSMFSSEMESIGLGNSNHLQKLDLILYAFDKEVLAIKQYLQKEYSSIEQSLKNTKKSSPKSPTMPTTSTEINTITKPSNLRLKKSPNDIKSVPGITNLPNKPARKSLAKDSPDIFNHTETGNCLNQNIHLTDSDTIISSPEAFSPKIKKKRMLRLHKSRELATKQLSQQKSRLKELQEQKQRHKSVGTPKNQRVQDADQDDVIASTPETRSFMKNLQSNTKKKLFDRPATKSSQSMYTLTQMYQKNESLRNKTSGNDDGKKYKGATPVLMELPNFHNVMDDSVNLPTQNSFINIDEFLERVSNDSKPEMMEQETEISDTFVQACNKLKCRQCDMKGSPCRKHMTQHEIKEPEQTFTGFWDLNFTAK